MLGSGLLVTPGLAPLPCRTAVAANGPQRVRTLQCSCATVDEEAEEAPVGLWTAERAMVTHQ